MTDLVPVQSPRLPAVAAKPDLSPALAIRRITPYRTDHLPDGAVLRTFWKIGAKPGSSMRGVLADPAVARMCAWIRIDRGERTFAMGFFPNDSADHQVVTGISIDKLPQAADDLIQAGFQAAI